MSTLVDVVRVIVILLCDFTCKGRVIQAQVKIQFCSEGEGSLSIFWQF